MIQSKHCDLCQHEKRSLKNGLTCGLTNKKPIFKSTCPDIKFSNSFKEYVPELLSQIEDIKSNKKSIHFNFYISTGISFLIIFVSYYLLKLTSEFWSIHNFGMTFLIFGVGVSFLSIAYSKLIIYKRKLKKIEKEKKGLDEILKNYDLNSEAIVKQKWK